MELAIFDPVSFVERSMLNDVDHVCDSGLALTVGLLVSYLMIILVVVTCPTRSVSSSAMVCSPSPSSLSFAAGIVISFKAWAPSTSLNPVIKELSL